MIRKELNEQHLKAICDVLGNTSRGPSKTELTRLLTQCQITLIDDGKSSNGYTYTTGSNKSDWLYNCFANEINTHHSIEKIYSFIEKALNPVIVYK